MSLLEAGMKALREGVAWSSLDHVQVLRVTGEGAFALLDRVSTAPLYVREGEMRSSLFLNDDGGVFADVTLARENGGYTLFVEGPTRPELDAYFARALSLSRESADHDSAPPVTLAFLAESHALVCLTGPFAWELASALIGPGIIGMSYLSVMDADGVTCYRAGKTGEYAYDFLVRRELLPAWFDRIASHGRAFDLARLERDALDLAALENWQFNIRPVRARTERGERSGRATLPLTPLELQLQWRVGGQRDFLGAGALRARKAPANANANAGVLRATAFVAEGLELPTGAEIRSGDVVSWQGASVGEILDAAWSPVRAAWIGVALLPIARAHPWLDGFAAKKPTGGDPSAAHPVPFRTVTPPLLDNRSLYVDPHRATYATRGALPFPPLVRG